MRAAKITGFGGYLPPNVVKNTDLEKTLDTTHDWIVQRTGIEQRHWVNADQATSDLALEASLVAIKNAGIDKNKIDMIVVATSSPDYDIPGTAAVLQAKLGLPLIPYFDIRQACSGFVYGLSIADKFIRSGSHECVLVVGAEVQSKALDLTPNGRNVSALFGDGAGAVIVQACEVKDVNKEPHIVCTELHADGQHHKELWMPGPGSALGPRRVTEAMITDGVIFPEMNGRLVFTHAVTRMPEVMQSALKTANIDIKKVDHFFFHQANLRINQKVADDLGIEQSKVHNTIHKFGNTTAATIPLGMYDAFQAGKLKPGMTLGLAAFGAGFTWASAVVRI
ncbi:MAG: beta-ketoacyl-ACP synthase III [Bdellovibrionia bacterium]